MNDDDVRLSDAGARDLARTRDGRPSPYTVRHTDPTSFVEDMRADYAAGMIDDNLVRVAVVAAPTTLEVIEGKWSAGGRRPAEGYAGRFLQASYFSRGRLVILSSFCGASWSAPYPPSERMAPGAAELTRRTALAISETSNRINGAVAALPGLTRRGGGVFVDTANDAWLANYATPIEAPPELTCATCDELIYWANNDWRHASTKRAEKLTAERKIDHVADPLEKGRKA